MADHDKPKSVASGTPGSVVGSTAGEVSAAPLRGKWWQVIAATILLALWIGFLLAMAISS